MRLLKEIIGHHRNTEWRSKPSLGMEEGFSEEEMLNPSCLRVS